MKKYLAIAAAAVLAACIVPIDGCYDKENGVPASACEMLDWHMIVLFEPNGEFDGGCSDEDNAAMLDCVAKELGYDSRSEYEKAMSAFLKNQNCTDQEAKDNVLNCLWEAEGGCKNEVENGEKCELWYDIDDIEEVFSYDSRK